MKLFMKLFALAAMSAAVASCDDTTGSGSGKPLTPDENKAKLDQVGSEIISLVNPDNHEDFCRAVDKFIEYADEGNLGSTIDEVNPTAIMASMLTSLRDAATKGDISAMMTKAIVKDYVYRIRDYYGIYEYDLSSKSWKYTGDDSKMEFRYSFDGKTVTATAAVPKDASLYLISFTDSWYDDYEGEQHEDIYTVEIPEKTSFSVMQDGTRLASAVINVDYRKGSHANVDITYSVTDMNGDIDIDLTDSDGHAEFSFNIGSRNLAYGHTDFSGYKMTDPDHVVNETENTVGTAEAETVILDEVRIYGKCSNVSEYIKEEDELYDIFYAQFGYDYYWSEEYNKAYCDLFNESFTAELSYLPGKTKVASLLLRPYFNPDTGDWDSQMGTYTGGYDYEPVIQFESDESIVSIESYFSETNFGHLVDSVEDLAEIYKGYFPYCFGE